MKVHLAYVFVVVGAGLLVYGLTGYSRGVAGFPGAGWSSDEQLTMAIGAMLVVAGVVFRRS